jgi:carbamoyltransferase
MPYTLSFAYNVHDSSVSVADEERIQLVLEAERHFGEKKKRCNHAEMEELIAVALRYVGAKIEQVESVATTAYQNEHLPDSRRDERWVSECQVRVLGRSYEALVVNHHLSHAAMVHAFPDAEDVVIDVCDGGGDFGSTHFTYRFREGRLEALPNAPVHDRFSSRFYDVVSRHVYGRIMCEGKLMALASLGKPRDDMTVFIQSQLPLFGHTSPESALAELGRRYPVTDPASSGVAHDLAASVQRVFEGLRVESVLALPKEAPHVMLAGGATLNILANTRVKEALPASRRLLLPPCCDDTGQSLGALLYENWVRRRRKLTARLPFVGFSDGKNEEELGSEHVTDELVDFLAHGGIVFLHRGQSEIGPRALGHRSIISTPTQRNHDLINHVIKRREFYRPLAPLVPIESAADWFDWEGESKYMLFAARVGEQTRLRAPGICHYDASARLQTVAKAEDPFLHTLLRRVGEETGCPLLINTSLNSQGVPIFSKLADTRVFAQKLSGLGVRVFSAHAFSN